MQAAPFDEMHFAKNQQDYTIVDIRNHEEVNAYPIFSSSIPIPLPELRAHAPHLPADKPVVVHCAGGYRSAIGASIIAAALPHTTVIDMGVRIQDFNPVG